jgi:hypothetical protein
VPVFSLPAAVVSCRDPVAFVLFTEPPAPVPGARGALSRVETLGHQTKIQPPRVQKRAERPPWRIAVPAQLEGEHCKTPASTPNAASPRRGSEKRPPEPGRCAPAGRSRPAGRVERRIAANGGYQPRGGRDELPSRGASTLGDGRAAIEPERLWRVSAGLAHRRGMTQGDIVVIAAIVLLSLVLAYFRRSARAWEPGRDAGARRPAATAVPRGSSPTSAADYVSR